MSEPLGWEKYLEHYLRAAERELLRVCPRGKPRLLPEEGNLLLFGRVPATLRFSERGSLTENKRWFPVLRELALKTVEHLVLTTAQDGYPGEGLLWLLLEKGPVRGLLISGRPLPPPPGSLRLASGKFFLPETQTDLRSFLRENWRSGRNFRAVEITLRTPDDLEEARAWLEVARLFGLTYLSPRAQKDLLPFRQHLSSVKRWLRRKGLLGLLRQKERPPDISGLPLEDYFLFRLPSPKKKIGRGYIGGLYSGNFPGPPLALVYAACEHSRRAGGGVISFEPFTYHVLGDLYLDWGDLGAALWAYHLIGEKSPQPAELLNNLGLIYRTLGLPEKAREFFRQALSLAPDDPLIHYNLAGVLGQEERGEALEHLRRAYQLSGQKTLFAEALARELLEQNRTSEAAEVLSGRNDLSLRGKTLLGEILYREGRLEEAYHLLREVCGHREAPPRALAYLALLYRDWRKEKEVAEILEREALSRGGPEIRSLLRQA